MTAPTPTARLAPPGRFLEDGFPTTICFAADPNVSLWEKSVKLPGIDGGDAIDITTMFNEDLRTKAARQLKTLTDGGGKYAYTPASLPQILALVNVETSITNHFPNGETWCAYGYLKSFIPADLVEGTQPEADAVIVYTNVDPVTGAEELPVYAAAVGTGTGV